MSYGHAATIMADQQRSIASIENRSSRPDDEVRTDQSGSPPARSCRSSRARSRSASPTAKANPEPEEVPMTETINLAKMGDGAVWHVLTGYVTDDIAKTACGIRRAPTAVEPGVDSRAVRHRGANVCANCRGQLDNRTTTEGGTTMTDLTDDLQTRASEAADAADGDEAPRADTKPEKDTKGRGGTATATKPRTRKAATTPRSSGNGDKPLSAIKAAEEVLRKEGKPLHVKELTQRILAMPNTRLGGKTPDATVGAILAVNIKKPDSIFRRTKPSTYTLKKGK